MSKGKSIVSSGMKYNSGIQSYYDEEINWYSRVIRKTQTFKVVNLNKWTIITRPDYIILFIFSRNYNANNALIVLR